MADSDPFRLGPWNEIGEGVYVVVAQPANVNLGLVVGDDAALLIYTGSVPAQGAALRARVSEVTDKPLTHVVLTHAHNDHLYGLAAFADLTTIGHEGLVADFEASDHVERECGELGIDRSELVLPTTVIALAKAVDVGGRRVEILHPGRAHTSGDLVVSVPDARVLFAGDVVEVGDPPAFGADSHPHTWPEVLDDLVTVLQDGWRLVPGHGDLVTRAFVMRQRVDIAGDVQQIEDAFHRGVAEDQVFASSPEWAFPEQTVGDIVAREYPRLAVKGRRRPNLPLA